MEPTGTDEVGCKPKRGTLEAVRAKILAHPEHLAHRLARAADAEEAKLILVVGDKSQLLSLMRALNLLVSGKEYDGETVWVESFRRDSFYKKVFGFREFFNMITEHGRESSGLFRQMALLSCEGLVAVANHLTNSFSASSEDYK